MPKEKKPSRFLKKAVVASIVIILVFSVAAFGLKAFTSYDFSTELGIVAAAFSVENIVTGYIRVAEEKRKEEKSENAKEEEDDDDSVELL